jgi:hypothetical protein
MCLSIVVDDPSRELARDEFNGFQVIVTWNLAGYRCGYLRVKPGHPWHGKAYSDIDASCHGGLTFAEADVPCDAPGPDEDWWVGFGCAHCYDLPDPALTGDSSDRLRLLSLLGGDPFGLRPAVRSTDYVLVELGKLASQARAAKRGAG